MKVSPVVRLALIVPLTLGLASCAWLPKRAKWVAIRPVQAAPELPSARADGYYASAVAAIDRRDYARALDLLQAARALRADDVRVINGFAVVYDKLGRFDLSSRYYAQAKALDPSSPIVTANMAYSLALQGRQKSATTLLAELAAPSPSTPAPREARIPNGVVAVSPGVVRLELPTQLASATTTLKPTLTGYPLAVINASGRMGGAEPVRMELARLGWTAPRSATGDGPSRIQTTIRYPAAKLPAARALARTLPSEPRMVACTDGCLGIQLIVGADSLSWKFRAPSTDPLRS